MKAPDFPADEEQRLSALDALELVGTEPEERFDRITRIARRSLGTRIALISLVDRRRQWLKSAQGIDAREAPRETSFCGHAILDDATFVVEDAQRDPRFHDNPFVVGDPNVRFYAGCPIRAPGGQRVGTLCVIDSEPRTLDVEEEAVLRDLATLVEDELRVERLSLAERELRQRLASAEHSAKVDTLTRVWSRATIFDRLAAELTRAGNEAPVSLLMIDVDHFKRVNDEHGHQAGDAVLREIAVRLQRALRTQDALGRYGGEEFMAVLPQCKLEEAKHVGERLRQLVAGNRVEFEGLSLACSVSIGVAEKPSGLMLDRADLIALADSRLMFAKRSGRDRVQAA